MLCQLHLPECCITQNYNYNYYLHFTTTDRYRRMENFHPYTFSSVKFLCHLIFVAWAHRRKLKYNLMLLLFCVEKIYVFQIFVSWGPTTNFFHDENVLLLWYVVKAKWKYWQKSCWQADSKHHKIIRMKGNYKCSDDEREADWWVN